MAFDLGDTVPLAVTVLDDAGAPTAASGVTLTITRPDGTTVASTTPANPTLGRYEFDFVPTAAGMYRARWASTSPATAFDDVIDVRASMASVVSLADAREYLNKLGAGAVDEDELRTMLAAAVERVDRHLFTQAQRDAGSSLAAASTVTESQVLAVKMVLAEFWRTQRNRLGGRGVSAASGGSMDGDTGPAGQASLTARLAELLGLAAADAGVTPQPVGSFPCASPWPDPAELVSRSHW